MAFTVTWSEPIWDKPSGDRIEKSRTFEDSGKAYRFAREVIEGTGCVPSVNGKEYR